MLQGKVNLTSSDGTTAQASVGSTYQSGGNTWVYCLATGSAISAYKLCGGVTPGAVAAQDNTTAAALGTGGGFCCVPQFDVGASEYFWAIVESLMGVSWDGTTTIKVFSENQTLRTLTYTTSTAGNVDDAPGGAVLVSGMLTQATTTTAAATKFVTSRRLAFVQ